MKTLWYFLYHILVDTYDYWNIKKKQLNNEKTYSNPKSREIWWCSLGYNIGKEIYGKGPNFSRPVLVICHLRKLFVGIPLTSNLNPANFKIKIYTEDGKIHGLLLDQIRCFDKKRLISKIYTLSKNKYRRVRKVFNTLFKK